MQTIEWGERTQHHGITVEVQHLRYHPRQNRAHQQTRERRDPKASRIEPVNLPLHLLHEMLDRIEYDLLSIAPNHGTKLILLLHRDPVGQDMEGQLLTFIMFNQRRDGHCHMLAVALVRCIHDIHSRRLSAPDSASLHNSHYYNVISPNKEEAVALRQPLPACLFMNFRRDPADSVRPSSVRHASFRRPLLPPGRTCGSPH